jgi:hypothetical protein
MRVLEPEESEAREDRRDDQPQVERGDHGSQDEPNRLHVSILSSEGGGRIGMDHQT